MDTSCLLTRTSAGDLSRRRLNKLLGRFGLAAIVLPLTGRPTTADDQVTYFTWAGYDTPEFFPGYVAKYHANPNTPLFADPEEAFQKLRAGFFADVIHPCTDRTRRWRKAGLLQSIDTARLSNWDDVVDVLKTLDGAFDDGKQWFVPVDWGNTSILYRADLVDVKDESWTLLWDDRYKGRLAMGEDVTDTAIICALVAGIREPYNMSDEDISKVKALLIKQKPLLRFYWSDSTALEQAIASGEVVAAPAWNSSLKALRAQGLNVKYMNPREGRLTWCCGLVLTAEAREVDKAYDLIDAILSPQAGEWLINYGYGHSNLRSFARVPEETLAERGLSENIEEHLKSGIFSRENPRLGDLQQMFETVKATL